MTVIEKIECWALQEGVLCGGDALMRAMFVAYLTVIAVGLLLMLVVALRHV